MPDDASNVEDDVSVEELELSFSEDELVASICRESFFEFVKEFWNVIIPEEYQHNWHIEYLCKELQVSVERIFVGLPRLDDIIINISPGTTKSTIVSEMLPAWCWTRMPSCRVIGGSHGASIAMDLSRKNRQIIKSERYRTLFPEISLSRDQDSKTYFVNMHGGSRYAVGVGGSVTGLHGHLLLVDDPIDPKGAISDVEMTTANRWMDETLATRKVDKAVTLTILIMQRLHQNDCTANMLEKVKNIKHICLPAEASDKISPSNLITFYKDGLMDPIRLSKEILEESQLRLGQYGYAGQFGQDPVPAGGGMFKVDRMILDDPPIGVKKWKRLVRSWDKAATLDGGCYTAGVKLGIDWKNKLWILDCVRGQWDTDVREDIIRSTTEMDGVECDVLLEQEPGSGGKTCAQATVRNLRGFRVIVERPTGNKVYRADPFSVQVNNRLVYIAKGGWNVAFVDEMKFFPLSKYKDQIDAASGGFTHLVGGRTRVGAFK